MHTKTTIAARILVISNGGKMNLRAWTACAVLATIVAPPVARAESPAANTASAFYVGNWMLDGSMPPFHPALGKSVGKEWNVAALSDFRLTPYMCLYAFKSDWTYRDRATWSSSGVKPLKEVVTGHPWTSLVVQPYGWMGLHRNRADMGVWMTDELAKTLGTDDFGDVESIVRLVELFQKQRPDIELVVFQSWPELPLQLGADGTPVKEDTLAGPVSAPDRAGFDYVKHWETVRYEPELKDQQHSWQTRDYSERLMRELAERLPELAKAGKLRCAPVGEVYNALEKKIRAGALPDVKGVTSFYADQSHPRIGLPRYIAAATLYAVLFKERPHALDASGFNDLNAYRSIDWRYRPYEPHLTAPIPITAESAVVVNDTVWEVVGKHPHTSVK
jgi:hypothetical protein